MFFNGSVYKDDQGNVLGIVIVEISQTKRNRINEAKVFAELATGIAEEEKINAENAAVMLKMP
jgi:hypothetical protein